jgi:hypothetical protein
MHQSLITSLSYLKEALIVLRSLSLFTLSTARYSSVISLPPEISTFDAIRRKDRYYRPFYTSLIGAASCLTSWWYRNRCLLSTPTEMDYIVLEISIISYFLLGHQRSEPSFTSSSLYLSFLCSGDSGFCRHSTLYYPG